MSTINVIGYLPAQAGVVGGYVWCPLPAPKVIPAPVVRSRKIDLLSVVRMAEGEDYQARQAYPVYQFGGGPVRRTFVQWV